MMLIWSKTIIRNQTISLGRQPPTLIRSSIPTGNSEQKNFEEHFVLFQWIGGGRLAVYYPPPRVECSCRVTVQLNGTVTKIKPDEAKRHLYSIKKRPKTTALKKGTRRTFYAVPRPMVQYASVSRSGEKSLTSSPSPTG